MVTWATTRAPKHRTPAPHHLLHHYYQHPLGQQRGRPARERALRTRASEPREDPAPPRRTAGQLTRSGAWPPKRAARPWCRAPPSQALAAAATAAALIHFFRADPSSSHAGRRRTAAERGGRKGLEPSLAGGGAGSAGRGWRRRGAGAAGARCAAPPPRLAPPRPPEHRPRPAPPAPSPDPARGERPGKESPGTWALHRHSRLRQRASPRRGARPSLGRVGESQGRRLPGGAGGGEPPGAWRACEGEVSGPARED
ncbi:hypothetical protein H8959_019649 [Pygathrix nigripes]